MKKKFFAMIQHGSYLGTEKYIRFLAESEDEASQIAQKQAENYAGEIDEYDDDFNENAPYDYKVEKYSKQKHSKHFNYSEFSGYLPY